jgi:hypothetical protein
MIVCDSTHVGRNTLQPKAPIGAKLLAEFPHRS